MNNVVLTLYSRKGCCLCEGLEQRLQAIDLKDFTPSIELRVIDIDHPNTSKEVKARYEFEVPSLVIGSEEMKDIFELPRPSPRLNGEGLFRWLQKFIPKKIGSK